VEREAGWKTSRIEPPVMILGHFEGVRTGISSSSEPNRSRRSAFEAFASDEEEIFRIKAYLIVRRNTTRDFLDFVALFDHLGTERASGPSGVSTVSIPSIPEAPSSSSSRCSSVNPFPGSDEDGPDAVQGPETPVHRLERGPAPRLRSGPSDHAGRSLISSNRPEAPFPRDARSRTIPASSLRRPARASAC